MSESQEKNEQLIFGVNVIKGKPWYKSDWTKIIGYVLLSITMLTISIVGGMEVYSRGFTSEAIMFCWIVMPLATLFLTIYSILGVIDGENRI